MHISGQRQVQQLCSNSMHLLQQPGLRMKWCLLSSQGLCEPLYTCGSPWHRPQPGGWHNQPWRAQPPGRECPALFGEVTAAHNTCNTSELKTCRLQEWCTELAVHCDLSAAASAVQSVMACIMKRLHLTRVGWHLMLCVKKTNCDCCAWFADREPGISCECGGTAYSFHPLRLCTEDCLL